MEDDAILVSDFDERASQLIKSLGCDFDLIQWGFNWDRYLHFYSWGSSGPISRVSNENQEERFEPTDFSKSGETSQLKRLISSWGSHCYTVSPTGAQKILNQYSKVRNIEVMIPSVGEHYWPGSFDGVFNGMHASLQNYIAFPPLSFVYNDKATSKIWV
jgi:GR25 family glycosyltransferase involved in LPS biosynthesis